MADPARSDRPVSSRSDLTVLKAIKSYKEEAKDAKRTRMRLNRENTEVYMGMQDWTGKQRGQSTEFIPRVPTAVETFGAFMKRALTQVGKDWYSVNLGMESQSPLSETQIRELVNCYIDNLPDGHRNTTLATILSDAVKIGLLESLIILKVHGRMFQERTFRVERAAPLIGEPREAELKQIPFERWRLQIDSVRPEDYFPDPTGRGLYEIHTVERDLHEVMEAAEAGIYDPDMVEQIKNDFEREREERRQDRLRGQDEAHAPEFRKRVVIDEFWGDILDDEGKIVEKNVLSAVANGQYLIRPPEPNPFWHQQSPFVVAPIVRVPYSVWHKALFDHASGLNRALNELFNLMIDGGIASVWGVKQLRVDDLEDPRQISGGISQGETLLVKSTLPHNAKVLERVDEGQVPNDSMAMFEAMSRELTQATLQNEIRLGALPSKEVRATEVVEASQSQAVTLDAISADLEKGLIEPLLEKSFLTILQNADDLDSSTVVSAIGVRNAVKLSRMSPADRYLALAKDCQFSVSGLSSTLTRVRDFQKTMALLQAVSANPLLFQAFMTKFSADKTLRTIMKQLNINPDSIQKNPEEMANAQQEMQGVAQAAALLNPTRGGREGGGGAGLSAQDVGEPSTSAEVNQEQNPMTGMV